MEEEKEEIKVLVLCSSRFAVPAMQQLAYLNQLAAVIIPDHCTELLEETNNLLAAAGIPVLATNKKEFEQAATSVIQQYAVNTGLVLTFSFIIPRRVFMLPAKGFFNVHPGHLPAYRGADPIFHQVKNREKYAAVTIHQVNEKPDGGDVVLQEKIRLQIEDTYGTLAAKLARVAANNVINLTRVLSLGFKLPARPQDETKAHYYARQTAAEMAINWQSQDADDIIALINACNPHNKGAAAKINGKLLRLLQAEKFTCHGNPQPPGTIIALNSEQMDIAATGSHYLAVRFVHTEEGFLTPAGLMQLGLSIGQRFENIFD